MFAQLDSFKVEIDFPSGAAEGPYLFFDDPTRGSFDTGKFAPADAFTDVSQFLRSGDITRGSSDPGIPFIASSGTCSLVLDNRDARFDPDNEDSPYYVAGQTYIRPMRKFRVIANGIIIFFGYVDSWEISYPLNGHDSVCTLTGTDGTKVLTNHRFQSTWGQNEYSGQRIERILDAAEWPDEDRDIDEGQAPLIAGEFDNTVWSELQSIAENELGELYISRDGKVTFRNRNALLTDERSTEPQAVFGNAADMDMRLSDIRFSVDDRDIANIVTAEIKDGTPQTVENLKSQMDNLTYSVSKTLQLLTDDEALGYAQTLLYLLSNPAYRPHDLAVNPLYSPDELYPAVLGLELGDRIRINLNVPGREDPITKDAYVRGVRHTFTPATWDTVFTLQDAEAFAFMVFDHEQLGRFDHNAFALANIELVS